MFPKCAIRKIQGRAYLFIPSRIEIICTTYLFSIYRALEIHLQKTHGIKSRYTKDMEISEVRNDYFKFAQGNSSMLEDMRASMEMFELMKQNSNLKADFFKMAAKKK
ncbi:MAG: hypothetical protein APG08_00748 [Candidatus Methanofastidiosum methylothiophilum]|uniref:Uncharacterized protein n=1 Tax=Candidatus Methanofastidiosum methylothiophilum TaxID=1705564 RepID=A0A150JCL6_9EURY|nr:MAG: hypothetical protein AN188_00604 [Candidatus Methanofastidiosum methylthiophilus]OQC51322.1 MAG: hypothetical protein BWX56_01028 [Euryarchaeota archaeon ADurb.Bin023]HNV94338.1 hypothetical protein [Methanofastidiosum sp.]KYC56606.1 MAG: hypothetical protein APG08_00748 [Candidatus Methanofastidiosum methylthiophilus]KYC58330.1 MAG: hypothetical protein APG09_00350 [Candidatus Methanofastidiosum methylthiophilus]